ncbi:MAG: late competence development ComFB family protein [Humidesulfovibrio sp.]|uniref:late competence development ComFB family protein n=1 Tax=Humidesulfovibrio sp. TaxID=2910988 RepID=UPI0027F9D694|nr:late competence development ComFB family protein [Humidesulfovibrio sp.]MDQ7835112.1 late competence development ComFB family protein [Humidesulfovibrio sp.]
MAQKKYEVAGVPLDNIRNRNELRVIKLLPQVLAEHLDYHPSYLDIQDIYALTLNNLPPRYRQQGTIIIHESVSDEEIIRELRNAVNHVELSPTDREAG